MRALPAWRPTLVFAARPPWELTLGPGDAATHLTTVVAEPFGQTLVGAARAAGGAVCRTRAVIGRRLAVEVANLTGRGDRRHQRDGAVARVRDAEV